MKREINREELGKGLIELFDLTNELQKRGYRTITLSSSEFFKFAPITGEYFVVAKKGYEPFTGKELGEIFDFMTGNSDNFEGEYEYFYSEGDDAFYLGGLLQSLREFLGIKKVNHQNEEDMNERYNLGEIWEKN